MNNSKPGFDQQIAHRYDQNNNLMAPIYANLHYLIRAILNDLSAKAHILCVGVGTGTEIIELAEAFPNFTFVAVDPSESMLEVCRDRLQELNLLDRCELIHGYIQDLPAENHFDAALCLLVLHHTKENDRQSIIAAIANRLKTKGYIITAEISYDLALDSYKDLLKKWQSMVRRTGAAEEKVENLPNMFKQHLSVLSPAAAENVLVDHGFKMPVQFFQSLLIRAWYAQKEL